MEEAKKRFCGVGAGYFQEQLVAQVLACEASKVTKARLSSEDALGKLSRIIYRQVLHTVRGALQQAAEAQHAAGARIMAHLGLIQGGAYAKAKDNVRTEPFRRSRRLKRTRDTLMGVAQRRLFAYKLLYCLQGSVRVNTDREAKFRQTRKHAPVIFRLWGFFALICAIWVILTFGSF